MNLFYFFLFIFFLPYCLVCGLQTCSHLLGKRRSLNSPKCDVFLCFCHFPIWCPGSGAVLDCIDSDLCLLTYFVTFPYGVSGQGCYFILIFAFFDTFSSINYSIIIGELEHTKTQILMCGCAQIPHVRLQVPTSYLHTHKESYNAYIHF